MPLEMTSYKLRGPKKSDIFAWPHKSRSTPLMKERNHSSCILCPEKTSIDPFNDARITDADANAYVTFERSKAESKPLRRKRSWFGRTRERAATYPVRSGHRAKKHCAINLNASLTGEYRIAGREMSDMLVLLEVAANVFADDTWMNENLDDMPPKSVAIILDVTIRSLNTNHFAKCKALCTTLIHLLLPQDYVSVLVNRVEKDLRIVARPSKNLAIARQEVLCALDSLPLDVSLQHDLFSTLQHASAIVTSRQSETKIIFLISDGPQSLDMQQLSSIRMDNQKSAIDLHTLGVGSLANDDSLRLLAHASPHGVCLPGDQNMLLQFLGPLNYGYNCLPLTDIEVKLKSFGDCTISKVKNTMLHTTFTSPQHVSLLIPRLSFCENYRVILVLRLPALESTKDLKAKLDTGLSEHIMTPSSTLVELEDMVNAMPIRLIDGAITYKHPLLNTNSRVLQKIAELCVRRLSEQHQDMFRDGTVVELNLQRELLHLLSRFERYQNVHDELSAQATLIAAEDMLLAHLIRASGTSRLVEDMLVEVAVKRDSLGAGYDARRQIKHQMRRAGHRRPANEPIEQRPSQYELKGGQSESNPKATLEAGKAVFSLPDCTDKGALCSTFKPCAKAAEEASPEASATLDLMNKSTVAMLPKRHFETQPAGMSKSGHKSSMRHLSDRAREIWTSIRDEMMRGYPVPDHRATLQSVVGAEELYLQRQDSCDSRPPTAGPESHGHQPSTKSVKFESMPPKHGKEASTVSGNAPSMSTYSTTPNSGIMASDRSSKWTDYAPDIRLRQGIEHFHDHRFRHDNMVSTRPSYESDLSLKRARSI